MLPMSSRLKYLLGGALAVILILLAGLCYYLVQDAYSVPRYSISSATLAGWKSYGGSWSVEDGAIHNDSDERGAKLMTGSYRWKNYTFRTDVKLDGGGDMGVVVRSNDEEKGVDAYDGYYVGLRTSDGTLVGGRSNYGWMESRPVPVAGGVRTSVWYRLTVTAVGCTIAAEAENLKSGQKTWLAFSESPCVKAGRIGLRSLATGGSWKNLQVSPASRANLLALEKYASRIEHPEFPKREEVYNRIFHFAPAQNTPGILHNSVMPAPTVPRLVNLLSLSRIEAMPVVVRGIVTLTSPEVFIEDGSGGALVEARVKPHLNIGDEIEVNGLAQPGLYSSVITAASIRKLWPGVPRPPISVTPLQAALGRYDRRFIEVDGLMKGVGRLSDGQKVLKMEGHGQLFRVVYAGVGSNGAKLPSVGSYLRVRGICVQNKKYTQQLTPFAVLLRSADDCYVLAGPPWWSPLHIGLLFIGVLILILGIQIAYFRIQQWKTHLVTEERERLAHDIHDTMAQSFAGISYQLQGIRSSLRRVEYRDLQLITDQVNVAHRLVHSSHEEASQTIALLGSSRSQERRDLLGELKQTANRVSFGRVRVVTARKGTPSQIDLRVNNVLLQIGQEAITNALRHSNSRTIFITLAFQNGTVELTVKDDGCGFDISAGEDGFGILGMQRRARDIHAQLVLDSRPGQGTTVKVTASRRSIATRKRLLHVISRILYPGSYDGDGSDK